MGHKSIDHHLQNALIGGRRVETIGIGIEKALERAPGCRLEWRANLTGICDLQKMRGTVLRQLSDLRRNLAQSEPVRNDELVERRSLFQGSDNARIRIVLFEGISPSLQHHRRLRPQPNSEYESGSDNSFGSQISCKLAQSLPGARRHRNRYF